MVYDKITYHEMKQLIDNMPAKTTIIDVRENQEVRQTGVIGPSVNIPCKFYFNRLQKLINVFFDDVSELKHALKKMNDKAFQKKYGIRKPEANEEVIVYCLTESRAARGADIGHSVGYKK
nr:unnamed protein product [Callosobruchus analis]